MSAQVFHPEQDKHVRVAAWHALPGPAKPTFTKVSNIAAKAARKDPVVLVSKKM
jgi:hypothetical protein